MNKKFDKAMLMQETIDFDYIYLMFDNEMSYFFDKIVKLNDEYELLRNDVVIGYIPFDCEINIKYFEFVDAEDNEFKI